MMLGFRVFSPDLDVGSPNCCQLFLTLPLKSIFEIIGNDISKQFDISVLLPLKQLFHVDFTTFYFSST